MTAPELYVDCALRGELVAGVPQWRVLDETKRPEDAGHRPFGVLDVVMKSDRVRVYHAPLQCLSSCPASSDETYLAHRIHAGSSAGLTYVDVFLKTSDGTPVAPADACIPYSNVWLTGRGWIVPAVPA